MCDGKMVIEQNGISVTISEDREEFAVRQAGRQSAILVLRSDEALALLSVLGNSLGKSALVINPGDGLILRASGGVELDRIRERLKEWLPVGSKALVVPRDVEPTVVKWLKP